MIGGTILFMQQQATGADWALVLPHIAVFVAYFVLDIVWAWYTKAIAAHHALRAALWAGIIPLLVMGATLLAVEDWTLVFSAAGGGAIGTYVAVRRFK